MTRDGATETKLEKSKRHYSDWVVNEKLEDYSLRYVTRSLSLGFIFFALEREIMAQALELYFGLPLANVTMLV